MPPKRLDGKPADKTLWTKDDWTSFNLSEIAYHLKTYPNLKDAEHAVCKTDNCTHMRDISRNYRGARVWDPRCKKCVWEES